MLGTLVTTSQSQHLRAWADILWLRSAPLQVTDGGQVAVHAQLDTDAAKSHGSCRQPCGTRCCFFEP